MDAPAKNGAQDSEPYPYDLGKFHRQVATNSPIAQRWFDNGLIWTYGFCHDEAIACFEKSVQSDPECAAAYWGIAYAVGPNYNQPWDFFNKEQQDQITDRARNELFKARNASGSTPVEKALISALSRRFDGDIERRNQAYADAMEMVYHQYPDDVDIGVLYVDAVMNISPWKLWDIWTRQPAAHTLKMKETLERILKKHPDHPGAIHLYIHLMEMSPTPELALEPAKDLRLLVPASGHLHHMVSHITLQCGMWSQTLDLNAAAVRADTEYLDRVGSMRFYALYRAHNWHFRTYAAMQSGRKQEALESITGMEDCVPEAFVKQMPDFVESMFALRAHVLVRWQEILDTPLRDEFWSYTNAMLHYAKGTALAVLGQLDEAEKERKKIDVKPSRMLFNNTCPDLVELARAMLDGEIEFRRDGKLDNLKKAVKLNDKLKYAEPWAWMHPPRHALGALMLESGRVEEALEVYEMDLGYRDLPRALCHIKNVWSLHGYVECLRTLGQDSTEAQGDLEQALGLADVEVTSSCACRK